MCIVYIKNIHWCWRYLSGRTKFLNIWSIWANKNGDESAILNFIRTKLHRIHGRILVNAFLEYQDECIFRVSGWNVHWCWRYSSRRTKSSNILSIWANKNGDESAFLNFIRTKLHWNHGMIVVNACVEYKEEMFIGVGDIYPDGQNFQIFCQFEQTKMAINRPFWIWSGQKVHRIHKGMVINACV